MSIVNLLMSAINALTVVDFKVGSFQFDLLTEENHESSVDVTENPIERGAPTTDHIIDRNDTLTVSGIILSHRATGGGGSSSRKKDIYESLLQIKDAKQPVVVKTTLKQYKNMVLTGVGAVQGDTDRLDVVLNFREIGIVETETAGGLVVPSASPAPAPKAPPKNNPSTPKPVKKADAPTAKGKVQPSPPPQPAKKKSAARSIGDIIRG